MVKIKSKKRKWIISLLLGVFAIGMVATVGIAVSEVVSPTEAVYAEEPPVTTPVKEEPPVTTPVKDKPGGLFDIDFGGLADAIVAAILTKINAGLVLLVVVLGWLLTFLVDILQIVANYTKFGEQQQVIDGWVMVRDIVNSFFIVVLIAIAISTIIRVQQYHFKSTLPKLIIAAFLVNFSRTICLLAIDFSTSIMLFFVNALGEAWPAFLLGLRAIATTSMSSDAAAVYGKLPKPTESVNEMITAASLTMGALSLLLAGGAILMFVIILLYRIVMLWILMILSPLAFFLWGVPGRANKYWGTWLDKFVKEIIVGPVIAFFLYINILFFVNNLKKTEAGSLYGFDLSSVGEGTSPLLNMIGDSTILFGYVIGLALMFVTVEVATEIGARGTGMAQKMRGKYFGAFKGVARGVGRGVGAVGGYTRDAWYGKKGTWGLTRALLKPKHTLSNIKSGLAARQAKNIQAGMSSSAQRAKDAGAEGHYGRMALHSLLGGNKEMVQNNGLMLGTMLKAAVPTLAGAGVYQSTQKMADTLEETVNKQKAAVWSKDLEESDPESRAHIGGMTRSSLVGATKFLDENHDTMGAQVGVNNTEMVDARSAATTNIEKNNAEKAKLQATTQGADYQKYKAAADKEARGERLTGAEGDVVLAGEKGGFNKVNEQMQALDEASAKETVQMDAKIQTLQQNNTDISADMSSNRKQRQFYSEADQMLGAAGVTDKNANIGEVLQTFEQKNTVAEGQTTSVYDGSIKEMSGQLNQRKKKASEASAGMLTEYRKGAKEYRESTYVRDEKYGKSVLKSNAMSNANPNSRAEFEVDMNQSADQGHFEEVMSAVVGGEGVDFDDTDSIKKMVKHLTSSSGVGMDKSHAMSMLSAAQGRNRSDGRVVGASFITTSEGSGQMKVATNDQRRKLIKANMKVMMQKALTKGGMKGLTVKKADTGKRELAEGVVDAIVEDMGKFNSHLEDPRIARQIETDVLKKFKAEPKIWDKMSTEAQAELNSQIRE